jgi:hypothetical protein
MNREQRIHESLRQYEDGAITFIEFIRFTLAQVTEQDIKEQNSCVYSDDQKVEWPFRG